MMPIIMQIYYRQGGLFLFHRPLFLVYHLAVIPLHPPVGVSSCGMDDRLKDRHVVVV